MFIEIKSFDTSYEEKDKFNRLLNLYIKLDNAKNDTKQTIRFKFEYQKTLNVNLENFVKFVIKNMKIFDNCLCPSMEIKINEIFDSDLFKYHIKSVYAEHYNIICALKPHKETKNIKLILESRTGREKQNKLKYLFENCTNTEFSGDLTVYDPCWKLDKNLGTKLICEKDNNYISMDMNVYYDFITQISESITKLELYNINSCDTRSKLRTRNLMLPHLIKLIINETNIYGFEMENILRNHSCLHTLKLKNNDVCSKIYDVIVNSESLIKLKCDNLSTYHFSKLLSENKSIKYLHIDTLFNYQYTGNCNITKINDNFASLSVSSHSLVMEDVNIILSSNLKIINIKMYCKEQEEINYLNYLTENMLDNLLVCQLFITILASKKLNKEKRTKIKNTLRVHKTLQSLLDKKTIAEKIYT